MPTGNSTAQDGSSTQFLNISMNTWMTGLASGTPLLVACLRLALEVIDAGDRVVANHIRCQRLVARIRTLLPLLKALDERLAQAKSQQPPFVDVAAEGCSALAMLEAPLGGVHGVLEDVRVTILSWAAEGGSRLRFLVQLIVSASYQAQFIDLNERLSAAYNDLGLALALRNVGVQDIMQEDGFVHVPLSLSKRYARMRINGTGCCWPATCHVL